MSTRPLSRLEVTDIENFPQLLRGERRWVCWQGDKMPICPSSGRPAKANDDATWGTLEQALARYRGDEHLFGVGIQLGRPLVGIDLDGAATGGVLEPWAQAILKRFPTYAEWSPSGTGVHILLYAPEAPASLKCMDYPMTGAGIEFYAERRYFTVTGRPLPGVPAEIRDCSDELGAWLAEVRAASRPAPRETAAKSTFERAEAYVMAIPPAVEGQHGDDTTFRVCCALVIDFDLSDADALVILGRWNRNCQPPWSENELRAKLASARRNGTGVRGSKVDTPPPPRNGRSHREQPPAFDGAATDRKGEAVGYTRNRTDLGNGRRLVERHGQDMRFCHASKSWYIWNGSQWARDTTAEVVRRAKDTAEAMFVEAYALIEGRKEAVKWALQTESNARLMAMVALAASEPGIPILPGDLDADPWLLNCRNGILDLRTGVLAPHRREALLSKIIPVDFAPGATCPTWLGCLTLWMAGRKPLVEYLRRVVGYCLTGSTHEHVLFFLFGSGRNGKSTFLDVLRLMLGDYAKQAEFSTFLERKNETVRNDLADLNRARAVCASEAERGARLAEALVKTATGGDALKARFLFQEYFEFVPEFKLFLAANHKPIIRGTDEGIWSRIRLIPFEVFIPDDQRDKALPEKLRAELPGILNWAVGGCLEWQRGGLQDPPEVLGATKAYREEMDPLGAFLGGCLIRPEARAKASDLYAAYRAWAEQNGEEPVNQTAFGLRLGDRGFTSTRGTGGTIWRKGIGVPVNSEGL